MCCLAIENGAIVVGMLNIIGLITSIFNIDIVEVSLKLFTCCWFAAMMMEDTKSRRFGFFVTYLTQVCVQFVLESFIFYDILSDPLMPKEVC